MKMIDDYPDEGLYKNYLGGCEKPIGYIKNDLKANIWNSYMNMLVGHSDEEFLSKHLRWIYKTYRDES